MPSTLNDGWDIRKIYELPPADIMEAEAFFSAFAKFRDINGHTLECVKTRLKSTILTAAKSSQTPESSGLNLADTVLILRTSDVKGITAGESIRVEGELFRIISVSYPLHEIARLDLQGIES